MKKMTLLLLFLVGGYSATGGAPRNMSHDVVIVFETLAPTLKAEVSQPAVSKATIPEKHIVVVVPGYNNIQWYKDNLDSIFSQKYENYEVIYIDDGSTDKTYEAVCEYVKFLSMEDKIKIVHNKVHNGSSLKNHYDAIHTCRDSDIIISLDGDDWLAHDHVLARINEIYSDGVTWLTYGQFMMYPSQEIGWCEAFPAEVMAHNRIRSVQNAASHLKTFYAGLFKKIAYEDLLDNTGNFYKKTHDLAMMFPMVEMARNGHVMFVPEVLYIYNDTNPISDHRIALKEQRSIDKILRDKKPYDALKTLDF